MSDDSRFLCRHPGNCSCLFLRWGDWRTATVCGGKMDIFFFPTFSKVGLLPFLPFSRHPGEHIPLLLCFQGSFIISLTSEKKQIKNRPHRPKVQGSQKGFGEIGLVPKSQQSCGVTLGGRGGLTCREAESHDQGAFQRCPW